MNKKCFTFYKMLLSSFNKSKTANKILQQGKQKIKNENEQKKNSNNLKINNE